MADRGDKYVIEIADVAYITQDDGLKRQIYRIKGFNTLILDDYALSKLTELEGAVVNADEAFKRGYDEGYKEAAETIRLDRQNEAQDEAIEVGDEVEVDDYIGVVTCIESDGYRIMLRDGTGCFFGKNYHTLKKTGRHFPIQDLLDDMKAEWHSIEDDGEHDGCERCIHVGKTEYEFPCADCCHNGNDGGRSYFERSE